MFLLGFFGDFGFQQQAKVMIWILLHQSVLWLSLLLTVLLCGSHAYVIIHSSIHSLKLCTLLDLDSSFIASLRIAFVQSTGCGSFLLLSSFFFI